MLIASLKRTTRDLLIYYTDADPQLEKKSTLPKFTAWADKGLMKFEIVNGLASHIIPIERIDRELHESITLRAIKHWKPGFRYDIKENEKIRIRFTRTLKQYYNLEGSEFQCSNFEPGILNRKIVILGYTGPTDEDKHFTPIRLAIEHPKDEPDTYGSVILANAIRTILESEVKE